jgi:hypothetical protein
LSEGGGNEVLMLVLPWAVTTALTFAIVIVDERRMSAERLERAWPPASRDAAIVVFGPLALLIHFMKTRGHLRSARGVLGLSIGLVMGVVAVGLVAVASGLVVELVARIAGLPTD